MVTSYSPKLGVPTIDYDDPNWKVPLEQGFKNVEDRLTLQGAGAPTGVVGHWIGQVYIDTGTRQRWICLLPGGASTQWVRDIADYVATPTELANRSGTYKILTTDNAKNYPGVAKAMARFDGRFFTGQGIITPLKAVGIAQIERTGVGEYKLDFGPIMADAEFIVLGTAYLDTQRGYVMEYGTRGQSFFRVRVKDGASASNIDTIVNLVVF